MNEALRNKIKSIVVAGKSYDEIDKELSNLIEYIEPSDFNIEPNSETEGNGGCLKDDLFECLYDLYHDSTWQRCCEYFQKFKNRVVDYVMETGDDDIRIFINGFDYNDFREVSVGDTMEYPDIYCVENALICDRHYNSLRDADVLNKYAQDYIDSVNVRLTDRTLDEVTNSLFYEHDPRDIMKESDVDDTVDEVVNIINTNYDIDEFDPITSPDCDDDFPNSYISEIEGTEFEPVFNHILSETLRQEENDIYKKLVDAHVL